MRPDRTRGKEGQAQHKEGGGDTGLKKGKEEKKREEVEEGRGGEAEEEEEGERLRERMFICGPEET